MANSRHVRIAVDQSKWDAFRETHPRVTPDLRGANLEEAHLWGDFGGTLFDGAYLKGASMPAQLNGASFVGARMRRAKLQGDDPRHRVEFERRGAIFRTAHMSDAFLFNGDYTDADFSTADLRGARLTGSLLVRANFTAANLQDAVFDEAELTGAVFAGASFRNTTFHRAVCGGTVFDAVDFSEARGLESITHRASSTVTLDATFRSQGHVSEQFLSGTHPHVSPDALRAMRDAVRSASSGYHSCFISYAHASHDSSFVEKLSTHMKNEGITYWLDDHSLRPGEPFEDRIISAIAGADRFVVVLSAAALRSKWVRRELAIAAGSDASPGAVPDREPPSPRARIVPIRLDDVVVGRHDEPWRVLQHLQITDFSRWRSARPFKKQFDQLASALKRDHADPADE